MFKGEGLMSAQTKIFVFKMKSLIYAAIFSLLGILLIALLIYMFYPNKKESAPTSVGTTNNTLYTPGIYSSSITLDDQTIDIAVTVDSNQIKAINFVNLNETVSTMYPLMETALHNISEQIYTNQSTTSISYSEDMKYTATVLIRAIEDALKSATSTK